MPTEQDLDIHLCLRNTERRKYTFLSVQRLNNSFTLLILFLFHSLQLASELERARSSTTQANSSRSPPVPTVPTEQDLDKQELNSFVDHLKWTMQRLPAPMRLEAQEEMLGITYAKKHELLRSNCTGHPNSVQTQQPTVPNNR